MKTRIEKKTLGQLLVDWDINPRKKSAVMIEEYTQAMVEYRDNALSMDDYWKQTIEVADDQNSTIIKGCHSFIAAKSVYGMHHEVNVMIHTGLTDRIEMKYMAAMSNIHGKPYSTEGAKKAVEEILSQTQNLKTGVEKGKRQYCSIRKLVTYTGIPKSTVWRIRDFWRAENNFPNDDGVVLTLDEVKKKHKDSKSKAVAPTVVSKVDPVTVTQPVKPPIRLKDEFSIETASPQEIYEFMQNGSAAELEKFSQEQLSHMFAVAEEFKLNPPVPEILHTVPGTVEDLEVVEHVEGGEVYEGENLTFDITEKKKSAAPVVSDVSDVSDTKKPTVGKSDTGPASKQQEFNSDVDTTKSPTEMKRELMLKARTENIGLIRKSLDDLLGMNSEQIHISIDLWRASVEEEFEMEPETIDSSDPDKNPWEAIYSILMICVNLVEDETNKFNGN